MSIEFEPWQNVNSIFSDDSMVYIFYRRAPDPVAKCFEDTGGQKPVGRDVFTLCYLAFTSVSLIYGFGG